MKSAEVLKAMGYDIRLDIIKFIELKGEASVSEIIKYCQLGQSAVSQHLAVLKKHGILKSRADRQIRYYSLANDLPSRIIEVMEEYERKQH